MVSSSRGTNRKTARATTSLANKNVTEYASSAWSWFGEYITPQGAIGITQYKYACTNTSIYYKYISGPLSQFFVDRLPPWLAPNVLTLMGFANVLFAYALVWYWCPTFTEAAPSWVWYLVAALLFTYQTLDNMDGKQARRLGCGSPLGLSLDHGCDAVATVLIPAIGCAYLQLGQSLSSVILIVVPPIVAFFMNWEEFYTGTFALGTFNPVDEGGLLTVFTFLSAAILGPEGNAKFTSWVVVQPQYLPEGFYQTSGIRLKDLWVIFMATAGLFSIIPAVVKVVRIEKWKKAMYKEFNECVDVVRGNAALVSSDDDDDDGSPTPWTARHYKGKRPRVRDAFGALLPVIFGSGLWICAVYFPFKQSGILLEHTRTLIWLGVMLFSKLITTLHVAHVCGDPYYQWRKTYLIPLALITLNSVYSDFVSPNEETIVDEFSLLMVCALSATVSWVHMSVSVIRGMCRALDIPFFTVPERCLIEYARKAQGAKGVTSDSNGPRRSVSKSHRTRSTKKLQ